MARKLRIKYKNAIYHVTIRGVERRAIFIDDHDRARFLLKLEESVDRCGTILYLFCLMQNHAHLLIETPQANLSSFMHKFLTAYTVYYNLRHKRSGHLMQGRFGAVLVQGDEYLLNLSRYVHLNPVFVAGIKEQPLKMRIRALRGYRWSSYCGYVGLERHRNFVTEGPFLALMAGPANRRRKAYQKFVEAGIAETDEAFLDVLNECKWGIGDDEFQKQIRDLHTDVASHVRRPEDVSFRQILELLPPNEVLVILCDIFSVDPFEFERRRRNSPLRAVAAHFLIRYANLNQRDVADLLKIGSGSAVCKQLVSLASRMAKDQQLCARIKEVETRLRIVAQEKKQN